MNEHSHTTRRPALREGTIISNRYRLATRIGAGGMGDVWRAHRAAFGDEVAIKFLMHSITDDARMRFNREARLATRLGAASRHITRVLDQDAYHPTLPYVVMELLSGETLSARVGRDRRLPFELVAKVVVQLCRALQVAHDAGVIHRDLKPANIFLSSGEAEEDLVVKLMDFGIAKATLECDDETTFTGTLIGTPAYMSPEQIRCLPIDHRTDLWAVGAVVYRLATGRPPFGQGEITELGLRIVGTDAPPPSSIYPTLPRDLDAWMETALAKSPEERFQSAEAVSASLASVAGISECDIPSASRIAVGAERSSRPSLPTEVGTRCERAILGPWPVA